MDQVLQAELVSKVGGKYRLVSLIQKRMRELVRGLPPLVEGTEALNFMATVVKEIQEGKVELLLGEEAERLRREMAAREADESAVAETKAVALAAAPVATPAAEAAATPAMPPAPAAEAAAPVAPAAEEKKA